MDKKEYTKQFLDLLKSKDSLQDNLSNFLIPRPMASDSQCSLQAYIPLSRTLHIQNQRQMLSGIIISHFLLIFLETWFLSSQNTVQPDWNCLDLRLKSYQVYRYDLKVKMKKVPQPSRTPVVGNIVFYLGKHLFTVHSLK